MVVVLLFTAIIVFWDRIYARYRRCRRRPAGRRTSRRRQGRNRRPPANQALPANEAPPVNEAPPEYQSRGVLITLDDGRTDIIPGSERPPSYTAIFEDFVLEAEGENLAIVTRASTNVDSPRTGSQSEGEQATDDDNAVNRILNEI